MLLRRRDGPLTFPRTALRHPHGNLHRRNYRHAFLRILRADGVPLTNALARCFGAGATCRQPADTLRRTLRNQSAAMRLRCPTLRLCGLHPADMEPAQRMGIGTGERADGRSGAYSLPFPSTAPYRRLGA